MSFRRQLRVCPTGGDKTIEFAALAGHYQPGKTLIIAHRDELIEQPRDKVFRFTGICPDVEKAEVRASLKAPIVVASVQTLCRRAPFPPDHFRLVVVDEAHHVLSESFQRVLAGFSGAYVLGVTATPDRSNKKLLSDFFENVAHETTLVDLIKRWLPVPDSRQDNPDQDRSGRCLQVGGDLTRMNSVMRSSLIWQRIADIIATDSPGARFSLSSCSARCRNTLLPFAGSGESGLSMSKGLHRTGLT